ncbi:MAG: DnaJ domain-containing protein [Alphaproteobacteria bacterium]|nr:DnaJ domain-containing protein [Alphaproteobacteria bacterium]
MKYQKVRTGKYFAPQNEGKAHKCDHQGCEEKGEYRAPKDKSLKEYYWFCLKHVQEYNAKWNYYTDGFDEDEPIKKRMHFGGFRSKIKYQFGYDFIDELGIEGSFESAKSKTNIYFNANDKRCAEVLGVELDDLTPEVLKTQYKKLVKKYHPDVNSGDKFCEEKFKKISADYKELSQKIK